MSKNKQSGFLRYLPKWAVILISVLASCLIMATVGVLSSGFTDWEVNEWLEKDWNPDNLIDVEAQIEAKTYLKSQKINGLEIDVDDYGVIKITGEANEDTTLDVATVTLPAGTYTIGGFKTEDKTEVALMAVVNGLPYYAGVEDETDGATFTLESEETVTIRIFVAEGEKMILAKTFRPTLASGEDDIGFWK